MRHLFRSFAGGEIAPELFGRLDLSKNQTGLARCFNFIVLPHGPVINRPGFEYIIEAADSTRKVRLIPFNYNTEQTYALEFGHQYIRFHTNGGTVLETAKSITGITQATQATVTSSGHGFANGDVVFVASVGGMVEVNSRWFLVSDATTNTFKLKGLDGNYVNSTGYGAYTSGGTVARVYKIASPYVEGDLDKLTYTQSADVLTLVHPSYAPRELKRLGAANWTLTTISFVPTIGTPSAPSLATGGPGGGTPVALYYKTTALKADTLEESLASNSNTVNYDLTVAGNYVDVTPAAVTGAVRYNVYKLRSGLYGYIGQTNGAALRDNNIIPDVTKTPPEASDPFTSAGNYPSAVGYFEGRRVFAATNNNPQGYWLTRSATESNLSYSIPTRDDDAIIGRILARDANRIRHVVPAGQLIFLTAGGEWKLAPVNSDILTPDSASPKQDVYEGAGFPTPVVSGNAVLYVHEVGSRIRELTYSWQSQGLKSDDLSVLAPHLFDGYTVTDLALMKAPVRVVWCVRNDGALLGLTYMAEHQIVAWHQHRTDGVFESVCSVKEGVEYRLYAVVRRTVNGRTVRYIERMHSLYSRLAENFSLADAFVVDSGLVYSGSATSSLRGLHHLEGKTVSVLADGAVQAQKVVVNGAITLDYAATKVSVGLPYTSEFKTLPFGIENTPALGQGMLKNVTSVYVRVQNSIGLLAGPDFSTLREYPPRSSEPWNSPPSLKKGELRINIDPQWSDSGAVCIQQDDPLPLTVVSMTLDYEPEVDVR